MKLDNNHFGQEEGKHSLPIVDVFNPYILLEVALWQYLSFKHVYFNKIILLETKEE